jgi:hypothetical protein
MHCATMAGRMSFSIFLPSLLSQQGHLRAFGAQAIEALAQKNGDSTPSWPNNGNTQHLDGRCLKVRVPRYLHNLIHVCSRHAVVRLHVGVSHTVSRYVYAFIYIRMYTITVYICVFFCVRVRCGLPWCKMWLCVVLYASMAVYMYMSCYLHVGVLL